MLAFLAATESADPARIACAYPSELSGGERQPALLAASLAAEPYLLIADQPATVLQGHPADRGRGKPPPGASGVRWRWLRSRLAPEAGFEPATRRLTVACSTAELLRNEIGRGRRYSACEAGSFGRASRARQECNPLPSRGGLGRNRTGIDGFAVRYIATLPPGQREERRCYTHATPDRSSRPATRQPLTLLRDTAYKHPTSWGQSR